MFSGFVYRLFRGTKTSYTTWASISATIADEQRR